MAVYLFAVFIGALDTSIIGPAFPLIAQDFGVSLTWDAWTVTAYTIAYAAATVLAGALGDRRGRLRVLAWGLGLFGLGSLVTASAGSLWPFLFGRAVQGAGAGAMFPNAQAEGVALFPPERRGTALGVFGAVFGLAAIVGPNVGGALAQYFGWPAVFYLNVPLVALALLLARRLRPSPARRVPMPDVWGGLAFAGALAALLLSLSIGGPRGALLLVPAAALGLWFYARERRALAGQGEAEPFLDARAVAGAAGLALVAGAAVVGLDMSAAVFVPTLAQKELGLSVLGSGVAVMPAAVTGALLAGLGGVLVDRIGPKRVVSIGLVAAVLGGVLLAWPGLGLARFIVAMALFGLGTAFTMGAPLNRLALFLHAEERSAQALSLIAVFRTIGLAAGPVLLALAERAYGFTGLFGAVALASALGIALFAWAPDVRAQRVASSG